MINTQAMESKNLKYTWKDKTPTTKSLVTFSQTISRGSWTGSSKWQQKSEMSIKNISYPKSLVTFSHTISRDSYTASSERQQDIEIHVEKTTPT